MREQINVDDNLQVSFKAIDLVNIINHLGKGSFEFVEFPIQILRNGILNAHQLSALEEPTKPIGGGGGAPIRPKKSE
jgi:hypothetical protein